MKRYKERNKDDDDEDDDDGDDECLVPSPRPLDALDVFYSRVMK